MVLMLVAESATLASGASISLTGGDGAHGGNVTSSGAGGGGGGGGSGGFLYIACSGALSNSATISVAKGVKGVGGTGAFGGANGDDGVDGGDGVSLVFSRAYTIT